MVRQSRRSAEVLDDALVEGLGVDYVEQLDAAPDPADLATPWRSLARPFDFRDDAVRVIRNLPYSEAGRRGHLDIYLPAGDDAIKDAPVLLQVHGGAWTLGAKEHQGRPLMNRMAAKGWVCVAINYRLSPRDPWPAHIVDVKRAIAWVRDNIADHGGDPDYLVITGGSAGGHLAALAALTPGDPQFQPGFEDADTSVQAAVPFYGVYDFAGSTGLANAIGMRDAFLGPRVMQTTWTGRARRLRGRLPHPADHARRARTSSSSTASWTASWPSTRRGCSSPSCDARRSSRWCTPSCRAPSTPSTSSTRSAAPTRCGPSTATSPGTGTPGATASRPTAASTPQSSTAPPASPG